MLISTQGLCHCDECKNYTSSAYSINIVVSDQGWRTEGTFKSITKTSPPISALSAVVLCTGLTDIREFKSYSGGRRGRSECYQWAQDGSRALCIETSELGAEAAWHGG
jgi:hypothetical protein